MNEKRGQQQKRSGRNAAMAVVMAFVRMNVAVLYTMREKLEHQLQKEARQNPVAYNLRTFGVDEHLGQQVNYGDREQIGAAESQSDF